MPIHDQGYRRYQGTRRRRGQAWLVIARSGIRAMFTRRAFIALLLAAWVPFLVRAAQIYAVANLPQLQVLALTGETYRSFLGTQELFIFFVAVYAGAGLIANDRRANALQIYLGKPLTRVEYIVGKLAVLCAFLLFVSWVPAMLLLAVQVLFTGSVAFVRDNIYLLPAITLFAGLECLTSALAMLALSSLSRSSRYVAVLYAGLLFFTSAIAAVLRRVTGEDGLAWLSVTDSLSQVGNAIFRLPLRFDSPVWLCLLSLLVVIAAAVAILERRVRGVEVIA